MSPQFSIAHYRITAKLGEGGMGEVWRATDTKLNRDVAIKILPEAFAQDADRMVRFEREAQVLASLNHPNIAAIYGVEKRALIMELVEGEMLHGPLPVETALDRARQIAEALEYAHERGIIHRDLKPANIKVTPEGRVKVLDFGLAKAMSSEGTPGDPASSPTLTMRATIAGTILGTAAYMSPEQARGQNVDRRADIWAFGVVLYEVLTGRTLFAGPTISDTLAAVLTKEPDLSAIPAQARPVVERCLRKDPRGRWRDIGDVRVALEDGVLAPPVAESWRSSWLWPTAAAVLAGAMVVAGAGWWRASRPVDHPLTRLSVDLGPAAVTGLNLTAAISPDGRRLVFAARGSDGTQQLATRLLDQAQPTLLPGTEGGSDPFFSPDGQWIGFFGGAEIKKIPVLGGAPVTVCNVNISNGASWGEDENIIAGIAAQSPLYRVPSAGGPRQTLTKFGPGELTHRWPQVLPGAHAVLFTASPSLNAMDNANIEAISLQTGKIKILVGGGYYGRYLPSGHIVYVHQGALVGVRFNPERLEVLGSPVPILEDVAANPATGGGQFDFSAAASGTFVYVAGKNAAKAWQMAWLDNSGKLQPLIAAPGAYAHPRISPDGLRLAFIENGDIYIHDVQRDATNRLTFSGHTNSPVWAQDSKHLIFQSASNRSVIYWARSDGAADPQELLERSYSSTPWSVSRDGRLLYFERNPETGIDLWTLPLDFTDPDHPKPGKPEPFLRTPADETVARFSPDGRWIAYRSNESGHNEIYVRPFPSAGGGKWQVSTGDASYVTWSSNGRELFYARQDNRIMVVDYTVEGATFVPGKPRLWSDRQIFYTGTMNLDLAPDGKRFAVLAPIETAGTDKGSVHVTFLLNFFDELRRKMPVK
jgi:serine/threonine-protein kinase